ncbi:MAG: TonB-dependent receptor [Rikenellaceae bacterium]
MTKIQLKRSVICFRRWNRAGYSAFNSMHRAVTIGVLSASMSILSLADATSQNNPADSTSLLANVDLEGVGVILSKESPTRSAFTQTPIFDRGTETLAPLQSMESALRLSPSIDVRERGGKGVQADLSIRGGSFDQTMVLLNGINFTDARTGHQTHSLPIDMESISGIELIDGISGVGAYAGAINIRTAPLEPAYLKVDLSGGSYGYGYGSLSGGYSKDKLSIYAAGSYRRSDGYRENTEFENYNGFSRLMYDDDKLGLFDAQVGYQKRAFAANGFYTLAYPDQYETTETALSSLRWLKDFGAVRLNSSISYRKNFDCFELIHNNAETVPFNYHNTDNVGAEVWADYSSKLGVTTLGVDYTYNHIWSTVLGEALETPHGRYTHEADRSTVNSYLRHNKDWGKIAASASVGVSATPYGNTPLWSIMAKYRPTKGVVIELGANESMRLPTFTDLFYNTSTNVANENLVPEQAITYSLKSLYTMDKWSTEVDIYYRQGSNIIDWTKAEGEDKWYSRQITELGTFGAEWRGSYSPKGFIHRLSASYGYISQDKDSGDMISLYAMNYMRNKAALTLDMRFLKSFSLVVTGSVYDRYGNYSDASGESCKYEPYALLDARLAWSCSKWMVYLDATNITSTEYFDYGGLTMPGAWITAGVSFTL